VVRGADVDDDRSMGVAASFVQLASRNTIDNDVAPKRPRVLFNRSTSSRTLMTVSRRRHLDDRSLQREVCGLCHVDYRINHQVNHRLTADIDRYAKR
jgi:formate-dependent nitrite reductase cytochrome c552 subunit